MCQDCWESEGSPKIATPNVLKAVGLLGELSYDEAHDGPLHILVADWNIDDESAVFCFNEAGEGHICSALAEAMVSLSTAERASVLAINAGYWAPSEE